MGAKAHKPIGAVGLRSGKPVKLTGKAAQSEMLRVSREFAEFARMEAARTGVTVTEVSRIIALDMQD